MKSTSMTKIHLSNQQGLKSETLIFQRVNGDDTAEKNRRRPLTWMMFGPCRRGIPHIQRTVFSSMIFCIQPLTCEIKVPVVVSILLHRHHNIFILYINNDIEYGLFEDIVDSYYLDSQIKDDFQCDHDCYS